MSQADHIVDKYRFCEDRIVRIRDDILAHWEKAHQANATFADALEAFFFVKPLSSGMTQALGTMDRGLFDAQALFSEYRREYGGV